MKKDGASEGTTYKLDDFTYDETTKTYTKEITLINDDLGKYTVTEQNYNEESGVAVAVTYKVNDGKTQEGAVAEVKVSNGKTETVEFNNEYPDKVGKLVIKKTFGGPVVEADKETLFFEVKKDGADKATIYTLDDFEYDLISQSYIKEIEIMNDNLGDYTITEKNYNASSGAKVEVSYKLNGGEKIVKETAGVNVVEGKTQTVEFNNEYPDKIGKLVITKTFGGPVVEADKETLSFEVKKVGETEGTTYKLDSFKYDESTKTYTKEIEIKNGDLGDYTITEKNYNASSGAKVEVSYKVNDGEKTVKETAGVTVVDGKTQTVAFNNEYPQPEDKVGELVITKTFGGPVVEADKETLSFEVKKVGETNGTTYKLDDFTYDEDTETYTKKIILKNDELGEYTVTEKNYNEASGAAVEVSYKLNGGEKTVSETAGVTVVDGKTQTVEFNNEYPKANKLVITKTFGGPVVEADKETLSFEVKKDEDGAVGTTYKLDSFTYDENTKTYTKEIVISDDGKYIITEKNYNEVSGAEVEVTYKVGSGEVQSGSATSVKLSNGSTETVAFNNKYPDKVGKILLTKTFGGPAVEDDKKTLSFDVQKVGSETVKTYKFADFEYNLITQRYELEIELKNDDLGDYTITEKNYNEASGASVEVSYKVNGGEKTVKETAGVTVVDGKTQTVEFNNEYPDKVGKLVITKTFGGPVVEADKSTLSFEVKKVGATEGTIYKLSDFTYDENAKTYTKEIELKNDDLGEYTVTEKNYNEASGASVKVSYKLNGGEKTVSETAGVTVVDGKTQTVAFNNEYPVVEEKVGNLVISKTISGTDLNELETISFRIEGSDGSTLTVPDLTIANATDGKWQVAAPGRFEYTFTNLPAGVKYTVTESLDGHTTKYVLDTNNSTKTGSATIVKDDTVTVELTNAYKKEETPKETGKIYVHVTEEKSGKDVPDAEVVVIDENGNEKTYKTNEKGEIVDENGNYPDVTPGKYTVKVVKVPEGYDVKTGETGDVVVPKDGIGKHEAVIKTDRGGIIITVYDEETGDVVPNAEIEITTPDGKTQKFITDKNGQVTEYAKKDEYGNYTQKPGTFTYKVTKVPEGYKVSVGELQDGIVEANKLTELEALIIPRTGGLDIKVVDEKSEKPVPDAVVEIVTPDGEKIQLKTDRNGMITKFSETTPDGKYTARVGSYQITVVKVPEGYSVTTGQTKTETVVEGELRHHIAKIATAETTTEKTTESTTSQKTTTKTDTNAKTADEADIAGVAGLMLLSVAAVVAIIRRKKEDEE